jgi:hypothetical protein
MNVTSDIWASSIKLSLNGQKSAVMLNRVLLNKLLTLVQTAFSLFSAQKEYVCQLTMHFFE